MTVPSSRRRLLLVAASLAFLAAGTSAAAESIEGNGEIRVETRAPGAFTAVGLGAPADVEVRTGNADEVRIETDANLLPLIQTRVADGALTIRWPKHVGGIAPTRLRIVVQARRIEALAVAGAGSIKADGLRTEALRLSLSGSGTIALRNLQCQSLRTSQAGSGAIMADGKATRLVASLSGSGELQAARLESGTARVSIAGSGNATVWASSELNASLVGSGDLRYHGNPQVHESSVGTGSVRRIGGAP